MVKATYLLAGWTNTEPRRHTVQLVDSEHLSTKRSSLDPVTSMHVYSLQPAQPKVGLCFHARIMFDVVSRSIWYAGGF